MSTVSLVCGPSVIDSSNRNDAAFDITDSVLPLGHLPVPPGATSWIPSN